MVASTPSARPRTPVSGRGRRRSCSLRGTTRARRGPRPDRPRGRVLGRRPGSGHAPRLAAEGLRVRAPEYMAPADAPDPLISPIFGDLSGLPPLLIQVGSQEILL